MRKYLLLIMVLLLAMVPLAVLAQDDDDNECRDGGLLDRADGNGCESDWAWTCGWYLDNWLDNGGWANDNNFFPDWCAPESLLPPRPEVDEPEAVSGGGGVASCTIELNDYQVGRIGLSSPFIEVPLDVINGLSDPNATFGATPYGFDWRTDSLMYVRSTLLLYGPANNYSLWVGSVDLSIQEWQPSIVSHNCPTPTPPAAG